MNLGDKVKMAFKMCLKLINVNNKTLLKAAIKITNNIQQDDQKSNEGKGEERGKGKNSF